MAVGEEVDLWASCTRDTILQVRSGKLKKYKGLHIESAIDKTILEGPVHVGMLGIDGDEHDLTFHGGPDKAMHGCESMCHPPPALSNEDADHDGPNLTSLTRSLSLPQTAARTMPPGRPSSPPRHRASSPAASARTW